jgi:hypothetical protein
LLIDIATPLDRNVAKMEAEMIYEIRTLRQKCNVCGTHKQKLAIGSKCKSLRKFSENISGTGGVSELQKVSNLGVTFTERI